VLALIRLLEEQGPSLPFPYSSQVRGKLRELRTRFGDERLRVLYFADRRRVFILVHGFTKRTETIPTRDIDQAEARMNTHIARQEKKKERS
jgi:hypothetical protein